MIEKIIKTELDSKFKIIINAQESLYKECGFITTALIAEAESKEYYAHYFTLNNKNIRFRISKKTPNKSGQFVTVWKRIRNKSIQPYDKDDDVDYFVINITDENRIGQFIFPKSVLIKKNIFSKNKIGGKRAIRIYSPWDMANSNQALITKEWQKKYFIETSPNRIANIKLAKKLFL